MKFINLIIVIILFTIPTAAQTAYTINKGASSVIVKGTSSAHDWETTAEEFTGSATLSLTEGAIDTIQALSLEVNANELKSGKRIMDNKTKDALKSKDNPTITFTFASFDEVTPTTVTVSGTLSLAGVTNSVVLTGEYVVGADGSFTVTGVQDIHLPEYDISPPTAMMGALKTGEDVSVEYTFKFSEN